MPKGIDKKGLTPGEWYKNIVLPSEEKYVEETLLKRVQPTFVQFCKAVHERIPFLGEGAKFEEKHKEAIDFLGWDLSAEQLSAASKLVLFASIGLGILASIIVFFSPLAESLGGAVGPQFVFLYMLTPFIIAGFFLTNFVQNYPISIAENEKTKALTYVPEMVGYMIMSMKLVPNLEKAVEFSAEHGTGKIAEDFKRLIWDVQLGVQNTVSEALDLLAYKWGNYSEEFKQALMRIRASVLENTEAKRYQLLDATMLSILDSIRSKMEQYARDLSQPSVLLFYLGVLLPLILIIVLPVGSAFSGQAMATPGLLLLVYNIVIPIATFFFARDVISRRPPTQSVPVIPDNFPGIPKKNMMSLSGRYFDLRLVLAVLLVIGIAGSFVISNQGIPPAVLSGEEGFQLLPRDQTIEEVINRELPGRPANWYADDGPYLESLKQKYGEDKGLEIFQNERIQFFLKPKNDVTPYALSFGLFLTLACVVAVFIYYKSIYKRKAQIEILQMESEFKDSLYILASRMGENKPVEEALKHTRNFLPDFKISQRIFGKTIENIELLGMPLQAAVFDKNYGSLKNIPSKTIQTGMKIMVDSVNLGVNVAARTLISLSLQLRNSEKVNETLKVLISDTTSMMSSMSVFIAPIVLGVTTALQKVVMLTLSTIYASNLDKTLESLSNASGSVPFNVPEMSGFGISGKAFATMVTPLQFLLIVGFYVVELVIIMTYFTTRIQEDNKILFYINLARNLPIAVAVFLASVVASSVVVGGFFGG